MGSGKITTDTGLTAWSPIIMASVWGIAKEKGVLLQIEVRANLLWVVKEVHLPDVLDEDYQCRPNMILVQSRFVTFATESIWRELGEESWRVVLKEGCSHATGTPLEKNFGDMNFPSFLLLGSVPFLKLSTPGVLRSDLAHNHQVHKRFDPIYNDARQRIQNLGTFGPFGCTRGVGLVSCYL